MLLLSSLSLASVAFGAWTVGGDSYLLDGGSLQVAPILDASKYVSNAAFECTDFCDQGFVSNSTIVYEGTLTFTFTLKTGLSTDDGPDDLATYFGPSGIPVYIDVTYEESFANMFLPNGIEATAGLVASGAACTVTKHSSTNSSIALTVPYVSTGRGNVSASINLTTPEANRSADTFAAAAKVLDESNIVFDVWLGR